MSLRKVLANLAGPKALRVSLPEHAEYTTVVASADGFGARNSSLILDPHSDAEEPGYLVHQRGDSNDFDPPLHFNKNTEADRWHRCLI
jgi:hypothetical protein